MVKLNILRKSFAKLVISFLLAIALVAALANNIQILISDTDSLPQHYFLLFSNIAPKLHDYTAVCSAWYGKKVIKKIVGVSGDRICYQGKKLLVNQQPIGLLHSTAKDGRSLQPIKAQVIPDGLVFLAGSHARSFDSRYEEFGLVAVDKLMGLVVPIL